KEYYWKVKAFHYRDSSEISLFRSFFTAIEKPAKPQLVYPTPESAGLVPPVVFQWNNSARAAEYTLQISKSNLFDIIVVDTTFTNPSIQSDSLTVGNDKLEIFTEYFWRVIASNIGGVDTSAVNRFTVLGLPKIVELVDPPDQERNIDPANAQFTWKSADENILPKTLFDSKRLLISEAFDSEVNVKSAKPAANNKHSLALAINGYWFQLANDDSLNSPIINDSSIGSVAISLSDLDHFTNYYWRVKAQNEIGWGEFSKWNHFKTLLAKPVLVEPLYSLTPNSHRMQTTVFFDWSKIDSALIYNLEISENSEFVLINSTLSKQTVADSITISGFEHFTNFYWRVKAFKGIDTSYFSAVDSFKTIVGIPSASVLSSLIPNVELVLPINFSWSADQSITIDSFYIHISEDSLFAVAAQFVKTESTVNSIEMTTEDLNYETKYFWRVGSKNDNTVNYSEAESFVTLIRPAKVILEYPKDDITVHEFANLRYYWQNVFAGKTTALGKSSKKEALEQFKSFGKKNIITAASDPDNKYRFELFEGDTSTGNRLVDINSLTTNEIFIDSSVYHIKHNTNYEWRITAGNAAGWGETSEIAQFKTVIAKPAKPNLVNPALGDTSVIYPIVFTWDAASRADSYKIEISSTSDFENIHIEDDTEGQSFTISSPENFGFGKTYWWRVIAENEGGTDTSVAGSFTTVLPTVKCTYPDAFTSWAVGDTVNIHWVSNHVDTVKIILKADNVVKEEIGVLAASAKKKQWIVGNYISSNCSILMEDVKYADSVFSQNLSPFRIFTYEPEVIKIGAPAIPVIDSKASGFSDTTKFRMISLPGNQSTNISKLPGLGTHQKSWIAYRDNGNTSTDRDDYFDEYADDPNSFVLSPGKGYWLLSKNGITIPQSFYSGISNVPLDTSGCFSLQLHSGWNIISNPFNKSIPWSVIKKLNDKENVAQYKIFGYSGLGYSYDNNNTNFEPFKGYYFNNVNNVYPVMKIPYEFTIGLAKQSPQTDNEMQTLSVLISGDNLGAAELGIEIDENSSFGYDKNDEFAPPFDLYPLSGFIFNKEFAARECALLKDSRPSIGSGQEYNIKLKTVPNKKLFLTADNLELFGEYEIYLVDTRLGHFYNLNESNPMQLKPLHKNNDYLLLIGDQAFIEGYEEKYIPSEFKLHQNYPNPFNPNTVVRFSIPVKSNVTLEVFSILGEKVITLINNSEYNSGHYEVMFEGSKFASGVYLYRIKAGEFLDIKKMVLIK
ncbi:MAG: T9SS type A sorting domain-containing protein, partial [Bacteroidota bacterium]